MVCAAASVALNAAPSTLLHASSLQVFTVSELAMYSVLLCPDSDCHTCTRCIPSRSKPRTHDSCDEQANEDGDVSVSSMLPQGSDVGTCAATDGAHSHTCDDEGGEAFHFITGHFDPIICFLPDLLGSPELDVWRQDPKG